MKSRRLTRGSPGELVDLDFVLDCVVKIITIFTGHLGHFAPNTFSVISYLRLFSRRNARAGLVALRQTFVDHFHLGLSLSKLRTDDLCGD
jgi:hypothetical protein